MTNGQAATSSAKALQKAEVAAATWFFANSDASSMQLGVKWLEFMSIEMRAIGGSVSKNNLHNMINPTPFVWDLATTGNCD